MTRVRKIIVADILLLLCGGKLDNIFGVFLLAVIDFQHCIWFEIVGQIQTRSGNQDVHYENRIRFMS